MPGSELGDGLVCAAQCVLSSDQQPRCGFEHGCLQLTGLRRRGHETRLDLKLASGGVGDVVRLRSWDFDFAVLVQLAERDYSVARASMLPAHLFDEGRANARWSRHVKGWAVFMTPALMGYPEAADVTERLRAAVDDGCGAAAP